MARQESARQRTSEKLVNDFKRAMEKSVLAIRDLTISDRSISQHYSVASKRNARHYRLFGVTAAQVVYGDLEITRLLEV
jgi:hypothetical protein